MQTAHPTIELHFVFAWTYCKLRVYKEQETFAKYVLEQNNVEFLIGQETDSWTEIDTRILLHLVVEAARKGKLPV